MQVVILHDQKVTLLHLYILQGKKATATEYFNCFAKSVLGTATARKFVHDLVNTCAIHI